MNSYHGNLIVSSRVIFITQFILKIRQYIMTYRHQVEEFHPSWYITRLFSCGAIALFMHFPILHFELHSRQIASEGFREVPFLTGSIQLRVIPFKILGGTEWSYLPTPTFLLFTWTSCNILLFFTRPPSCIFCYFHQTPCNVFTFSFHSVRQDLK